MLFHRNILAYTFNRLEASIGKLEKSINSFRINTTISMQEMLIIHYELNDELSKDLLLGIQFYLKKNKLT